MIDQDESPGEKDQSPKNHNSLSLDPSNKNP